MNKRIFICRSNPPKDRYQLSIGIIHNSLVAVLVYILKQANLLKYVKIINITIIGRGPLGKKVAKNAFSWHPSREHLVCGLFERHIGTLPPKKVPKRKTCQILRKR